MGTNFLQSNILKKLGTKLYRHLYLKWVKIIEEKSILWNVNWKYMLYKTLWMCVKKEAPGIKRIQ